MQPEQPERAPDAASESPAPQMFEVQPLEAHIVALRAQLAHHERTLELATAAVLVGAVVVLVALYRGRAGVPA